MPLIAGVGTNDTRDSIEFAREVAAFGGFAAGLAIVPYYNKPSQEGMYQHFKAIADASELPIIIYNIPGRVVEMTPETMLRLVEHPNIIGVKECTSLANMAYLMLTAIENSDIKKQQLFNVNSFRKSMHYSLILVLHQSKRC